MNNLVAVANSSEHSDRIVLALRNAGLHDEEISLLTPDPTHRHDPDYAEAEDVTSDGSFSEPIKKHGLKAAGIGAAVGLGVTALAVTGAAVPVGIAAMALGGFIGTAAGTVVGGLVGVGFTDEEAEHYRQRVAQGAHVIAVHTSDPEKIRQAEEIFRGLGAQDVTISTHR